MKKTLLVSTFVAFASSMVIAGSAAAEKRLAFGATNAQSSHYAYFAALAKIVNSKVPGVNASVVETGATVDNLRRMAKGQLDLGLVTTNTLYHAYFGKETFKDKPIKSKLLWAYSLAPQNTVVRMDAGIDSLKALEGRRMGPGMRGSATEATTMFVMGVLGIKPDWVRGSNGELADAIKDNRAVGFVKSAVGTKFDALTTDIATFTPVRVLGISSEQQSAIEANLPELSIVDMPGGKMENSGPYRTWAFMIAVGAAPNLDDDTAYAIVKAAMEDKTEQAAAFPGLGDANLADLTLKYATSPLHPGAIRYFEEKGYTVPTKLR